MDSARAELPAQYLTRPDGTRLAYRFLPGDGATIVFLPGYMSDMQGSKARALADWAVANGRAMLRLDYSGCGESEGSFEEGTLKVWRDDVLSVIATSTNGPVILVGSSMGGWLMLLVAEALGARLAALVGIAAAPDFTDWGFSEAEKAQLAARGRIHRTSEYGFEPMLTTRALWESGQANLMLDREIAVDCPVRLLHGQRDPDVPWDISLKLARALRSPDVQTLLIKDGDHRLSRDADLSVLLDTVAALVI